MTEKHFQEQKASSCAYVYMCSFMVCWHMSIHIPECTTVENESHQVYKTYPEFHHLAAVSWHDTQGIAQYHCTLMNCVDQPGTPHSRNAGIAGSEGFCRSSYREDRWAPPLQDEHDLMLLLQQCESSHHLHVAQGIVDSHSCSCLRGGGEGELCSCEHELTHCTTQVDDKLENHWHF